MRVGIVLEHDRAVALTRGSGVTRAESPFDPDHPAACVAALRAAIGGTPTIRLAIGLGFLEPGDPALPPVAPDARQQMLALDSDRWFATTGSGAAVALAGEGPLAFAVNADALNAWLAAFETWGTIESVEPAPNAISRIVRADESGEVLIASAPGEAGLLRFAGGRLVLARRISAGSPIPSQARDWRDASHAADAARGTLLADEVPVHGQLLPPLARRTLLRRRRLGVLFAWAALAASLGFASVAAARWRERVLVAVEAAIASAQPAADRALSERARLEALRNESIQLSEMQGDPSNPTRVLTILARRLPRDAMLSLVRADSSGWEIGGSARDAADVVRALAADSAFVDVRAVGGTNRSGGPRGTEESFTVAFRIRGASARR